jgi:hypothetical protein
MFGKNRFWKVADTLRFTSDKQKKANDPGFIRSGNNKSENGIWKESESGFRIFLKYFLYETLLYCLFHTFVP